MSTSTMSSAYSCRHHTHATSSVYALSSVYTRPSCSDDKVWSYHQYISYPNSLLVIGTSTMSLAQHIPPSCVHPQCLQPIPPHHQYIPYIISISSSSSVHPVTGVYLGRHHHITRHHQCIAYVISISSTSVHTLCDYHKSPHHQYIP